MGTLDAYALVYYRDVRMGIERLDGEVVATYDVQVLNASGQPIGTVHPASTLTAQEKQAIAAILNRDRAAFELETGLIRWTEPEEPE